MHPLLISRAKLALNNIDNINILYSPENAILYTILHIVLPPTTLFLSTLIAIIFALWVKYSKYNCKDHDYLTIAENVYKQ